MEDEMTDEVSIVQSGWFVPTISVLMIVLVGILVTLLIRRYTRGSMYKGKERMDGKIVLITGANSGIGRETAIDLTRRGARVVLLCRNMVKAAECADDVLKKTGKTVDVVQLDLSNFDSVRECAKIILEKYDRIDVLINNGAILGSDEPVTKEGHEIHFGTNHLGHFLLTLLLLEKLKQSTPSRIVIVSSAAHKIGRIDFESLTSPKQGDTFALYSSSKLANNLFCRSLAKRLEGTGVTCYVLHPGVIYTNIWQSYEAKYPYCIVAMIVTVAKFFMKDAILGAQTNIFCAVNDDIQTHSGKYYTDCREEAPSSKSLDEDLAERLWSVSLEMTKLENFPV